MKGRYYWNKRTDVSMQGAEQYFQQAIDKDPTYAAAYSGLADCNSGLWRAAQVDSRRRITAKPPLLFRIARYTSTDVTAHPRVT